MAVAVEPGPLLLRCLRVNSVEVLSVIWVKETATLRADVAFEVHFVDPVVGDGWVGKTASRFVGGVLVVLAHVGREVACIVVADFGNARVHFVDVAEHAEDLWCTFVPIEGSQNASRAAGIVSEEPATAGVPLAVLGGRIGAVT